jgi:glycosyltransferase involved in cell wall biosynthesis
VHENQVVAIIDNSVSVTGAFKCALTEAVLLRQKFHFIFIVPEGATVVEVLRAQGFRYYTLPMLEIGKSAKKLLIYGPKLFQNAMALRRILKRENAAVIQVNDFYNLLGVAVKGLGFKGRLLTYVRFLPAAVPAPLRSVWISLAQRYADHVIAVSDAVLHQLPPHKKNTRIYDAVVLPEAKAKKGPEPDTGKTRFLYLSNYIPGKGQDHALQAFTDVVKQNKNVVLKFVGGDMGLQKNKDFRTGLESYVASSGLTGFVVFEAFQPDVEAAIKEADVVLNFSESESFSMTCAEASYYGVPVIATRCGGPEEIVVHEKTGLLVENRNVEEMKAAMLLLAASPERRRQYGKAAKAFVRSAFSAEAYLKAMLPLLTGE